ncbi:hypothetical protein Smp_073890 [Schistosoma mansoni]|uniref:hypothetical protein n=1 Tax=Schistosoma mansoni TaxID=6183 RepID=UPI00022C83B9|nr:hypothetical protein Smp_073890 [Schistosoma mansoni]|eukprot:XP_018646870.1 hypothetical protein Smp_073890 [Schistosoma mansoni]
MLTTALNFLTDKRKRFHRSDTMPAFTNDSNFFKLTSDNQIIEIDKHSNFLDLETNLYRHGKNHLNSSLNENISRRLSHGYSLSNVQVPLDNTSIKSDVCSSVTFSRKAFNDIHHNSKDRKINDSSKCRKFESTKSLRFPPELKDSCTFISGDSNTEQTIDSTMKVSNKSKVAKMRARAVARVTKSKLKRSKSSAYMSKHFQELNSEDNNNNNNNIRNRSSSTHRNSDIHFKEQHLIDNKIHSNLMKNWIDKTPRIRSDISPQNITNTTNNTNNSNIYEITNMNEYFEELVIIHVYADYPTGLNPGVSVRLLINMRTTVGEVIDTVVKQLLETADRKIFTTAENNDSPTALCSFDFTRNNVKHNLENHLFCLTVSVGQLERCLPNTVRLALLRRPWKFGKLTIRLLSDLPENIRHQITLNPVESKHSGLSNQIVSPLLTVTLVEPNLKQANINSPPEILH